MRASLTLRVLVVLTLAATVPTSAVAALAIWRARADVETEVVRGHLTHVRALGSSLNETLQGARRSLELASAWWADERRLEEAATGESRRVLDRLWRRLKREVPLFVELSVVDVEGRTIFGPEVPADLDRGAHSFGGFVGNVRFDEGKPFVPIVTQARRRTGERIGAFVARLDLSFVEEGIANARLAPGAELVVVDGNGRPIASSPGASAPERATVQRALGSAGEGTSRRAGTLWVYRNLIDFQSRRGVPWAIVLSQNEDDAFALARATTRDSLIIGAGVLTLTLLLGALLASRLTRPLRTLARRADAIAEGTATPSPGPVQGPGEIGKLAERIEEMAQRVGEREKLQAALAHGDRLASVGTITASVAHEINNPLTTILGYSVLLQEDKERDHPDSAGLRLIADEAARMQAIVGHLLDYSRREAASDGPSDIGECLERVSVLLSPSLRRVDVELDTEFGASLPPVAAGQQALQQIFINLVQNAAQAMPEGGRVHMSCHTLEGWVEVEVCDSGPGVPPSERPHIFEPFYTTKSAGAGTGLGLAVTKHLVDAFRGSIRISDGPDGRGARFAVMVPIADEPEHPGH